MSFLVNYDYCGSWTHDYPIEFKTIEMHENRPNADEIPFVDLVIQIASTLI